MAVLWLLLPLGLVFGAGLVIALAVWVLPVAAGLVAQLVLTIGVLFFGSDDRRQGGG